jgi:acetolactate synthase-1/2/3 large subunit
MATGADLLVECLFSHGVRDLFGMPGSHVTAIYDAVARHGGIKTYLVRNEQAGTFLADGYARVTGRPGVVCTTAGPGATNALTGVAEAWADGVPVLLVSGQVNHDRMHLECGNYHEIDLEAMFRPCTKFVATVMDNGRIPGAVASAFRAMTTGRRRPAALILPQDLMAAPAGTPPIDDPPPVPPYTPSADDVRRAADLLAAAKRPIIIAGGGAVWSGAGDAVRRLAGRLGCPVVTTLNGKGLLDERDPHSLGHARSVRARAALPHADAMLAVGCRFTEVMTWFHTMPVPANLVQIDIDPVQVGMNHPVAVGVVADARAAVLALTDALPNERACDWGDAWAQARAAKVARPEWLIELLRAELPADAVVFTDASEMALRMHTDYPAFAPRTFFYPSNYIALGWGFPAAVGAAVGLPGRVVASVGGDGGFVMTAQELATAVRYRLKVVAVVHNDSALGAIKNLQRVKHGARFRDTDLNNPDFPQLAAAYGLPARRASDADSFRAALREAVAADGPFLIEVPDVWRSLRA